MFFIFYLICCVVDDTSTDYPFNYAESPYMMSSGTGMTIIPQRQFFTQLAAPYSDCNVREDNELANERLLLDRELFEAVCSIIKFFYLKTIVDVYRCRYSNWQR